MASVTVGPDPARAGDTLTCTWSGFEDADGHADSSTVEWFLNEETAGTGETFAGDFVHGDTVRCVVTPFDGIDAGEAVSTDLVVSNTPPMVIGAVTISPNPPYDGVSLSCMAEGLDDADGETVTATFAWDVDSVAAGTGPVLSHEAFVRGNTVSCSAVPNDGTEDGPTVTSDALVVGNATPVVTDIPLAPSDPRTDDTISVGEVISTDADGDPVVSHRYAWLVDGEETGVTVSTLDGSVHFSRGDSVSVRARRWSMNCCVK